MPALGRRDDPHRNQRLGGGSGDEVPVAVAEFQPDGRATEGISLHARDVVDVDGVSHDDRRLDRGEPSHDIPSKGPQAATASATSSETCHGRRSTSRKNQAPTMILYESRSRAQLH